MNKKAIFLDIDGTYTYGTPVPPKRNSDAVEAARQKGHMIFINTGRSYAFIPNEVLTATPLDGVVAGNGAYVRLGSRVLQNLRMSREALESITAHVLQCGFVCIYEGEAQNLYCGEKNPGADWLPVNNPVDFDEKYRDIAVTKITVMGQLDAEFLRILSDCGMRAIQYERYAEAAAAECSKADGMRIMLEAVGISRENSIAMGDSLNDLEMIQYAGIGVAMDNAAEPIKQIADVITLHARDGGVGAFIEENIL